MKIGFHLSSEVNKPLDLLKQAKKAEEAGFDFLTISDHYHPWINKQGESSFVWCTLGGISQVTEEIPLLTGVTCPTFRIHPAIMAQAAATAASMLPGRFVFGVGSGENLSEHILGDRWPAAPTRIDMLAEAVDVIRTLWQGGMQDYNGCYYHVENAQIYTLPEELPPIVIAADGPIAAEVAAKYGDGLVALAGKKDIIDVFNKEGGSGKPTYSFLNVSYAESEEEAVQMVYEYWPIFGIKGELNWEIKTPTHFEHAAEMIGEEDIAENLVSSPNPEDHINEIKRSIKAGYDHATMHQLGRDQFKFMEFYEREVLPEFKG